MLSEVFWVAFIATLSALVVKCCAMLYKSKCKEIHCCCITIIRDIEAEARVDTQERNNNQNNNNNNNRLSQSMNRAQSPPSSPRFSML